MQKIKEVIITHDTGSLHNKHQVNIYKKHCLQKEEKRRDVLLLMYIVLCLFKRSSVLYDVWRRYKMKLSESSSRLPGQGRVL